SGRSCTTNGGWLSAISTSHRHRCDASTTRRRPAWQPERAGTELPAIKVSKKSLTGTRDTFYEVRRAFQVGGVAALVEEKRGPRNPHPNHVAPEVEQKILETLGVDEIPEII